jgi:hypothetical protein
MLHTFLSATACATRAWNHETTGPNFLS